MTALPTAAADSHGWMSQFVKNQIKWKSKIISLKSKIISKIEEQKPVSQSAITTVSETNDKRRSDYHCHLASKLNNPETSPKTYCSILMSFYS